MTFIMLSIFVAFIEVMIIDWDTTPVKTGIFGIFLSIAVIVGPWAVFSML